MRARLWLAGLLLAWLGCSDAGPAPPNLVLVIGDDHGFRDFGFMGSPHAKTPNLDRIAAEGTVFRIGYTTASVCRPSLLSLLTGLEPFQHALRLEPGDSASEVIRGVATLPRLLAERGYASFQAGKHLEGSFADAGFDDGMVRTPGASGRALARETFEPVWRFLERHRDRPFFLWFAPLLPHTPHDAPPRFAELSADLELPRGSSRYFANVARFDWALGELLGKLEELGLRERTVLVYLSDNGWQAGSSSPQHLYALGGPRGKASLHELGLRTPIVFYGPGRIPAGVVRDDLVSSTDLFPTLLDFAGAPRPPGLPGRSLRPRLEGGEPVARDALVVYQRGLRRDTPDGRVLERPRSGFSVRTRRWHYLRYEAGPEELYDLRADPDEERDVAGEHPEIAKALRQRTARLQAEMRRLAPPP